LVSELQQQVWELDTPQILQGYYNLQLELLGRKIAGERNITVSKENSNI
jgi:hypothetical protein